MQPGQGDSDDEADPRAAARLSAELDGTDRVLFEGRVPCESSGTQGITVRLLPDHEDLAHAHCVRLIRWA